MITASSSTRLSPEDCREIEDEITAGKWDRVGVLLEEFRPGVRNSLLQRGTPFADAEDIVQDAYYTFLKTRQFNRKKGKLITYLINVARNKSIDRFRRRRCRPIEGSCDDFSRKPANLSEDVVELRERNGIIKEAVGHIPSILEEYVYLSYGKDFSTREIAKICERPTGTIKSGMHRARQSLLKELQTWR